MVRSARVASLFVIASVTALGVVAGGCDLASLLSPPPVDGTGGSRPSRDGDGSDDDCDADADCNGGEFCDDGTCRDFGDGGEGEGEAPAEGEGEAPPPPPPTCGDAGCPEILSLTSNRSLLREFDSAAISAVVTDPDGVADVIGGVLFDPISGGTYSTFSATGAGTFEVGVSWSVLGAVRSIDFTGDTSRVVRARFFDQAGNESFADVTLTLTCADADGACDGECGAVRCDGACVTEEELTSDDHCGACGNACVAPEFCGRLPDESFACGCEGPDCTPTTPGTPYSGRAEDGVVCGGAGTCPETCCLDFNGTSTCTASGSCFFGAADCDGPEDCAGTNECCFSGFGASCVAEDSCRENGNREVCVDDGDCNFGERCCSSDIVTAFGGDAGVCAVMTDTGDCPDL